MLKPKGGHDGNCLLYEVQEESRHKKPTAGDAEEPQTSDTRCVSPLWHQSVQNRESLNIYSCVIAPRWAV
jgi:hypothetical protein